MLVETDHFSVVTQTRGSDGWAFENYYAYLEGTSYGVTVADCDWGRLIGFSQLCAASLKRVFYRIGRVMLVRCDAKRGKIEVVMRGGSRVWLAVKPGTLQLTMLEIANQIIGVTGLDPDLMRAYVVDATVIFPSELSQ
ncbi:MAG: hypothetical protein B7Z37_28935 [Verrucomicrobia bacterium 12-59-8]|nr:MAG: hypothetical protein B7Z37_28935 [Verrucomicrobia bacterium 12-59-8]